MAWSRRFKLPRPPVVRPAYCPGGCGVRLESLLHALETGVKIDSCKQAKSTIRHESPKPVISVVAAGQPYADVSPVPTMNAKVPSYSVEM